MNARTQRQLTSGRISDNLDAPPHPVVCQNGSFYAFEVNDRYPTAVTIPGIGLVYAKHFKNWAGRPLLTAWLPKRRGSLMRWFCQMRF